MDDIEIDSARIKRTKRMQDDTKKAVTNIVTETKPATTSIEKRQKIQTATTMNMAESGNGWNSTAKETGSRNGTMTSTTSNPSIDGAVGQHGRSSSPTTRISIRSSIHVHAKIIVNKPLNFIAKVFLSILLFAGNGHRTIIDQL